MSDRTMVSSCTLLSRVLMNGCPPWKHVLADIFVCVLLSDYTCYTTHTIIPDLNDFAGDWLPYWKTNFQALNP